MKLRIFCQNEECLSILEQTIKKETNVSLNSVDIVLDEWLKCEPALYAISHYGLFRTSSIQTVIDILKKHSMSEENYTQLVFDVVITCSDQEALSLLENEIYDFGRLLWVSYGNNPDLFTDMLCEDVYGCKRFVCNDRPSIAKFCIYIQGKLKETTDNVNDIVKLVRKYTIIEYEDILKQNKARRNNEAIDTM